MAMFEWLLPHLSLNMSTLLWAHAGPECFSGTAALYACVSFSVFLTFHWAEVTQLYTTISKPMRNDVAGSTGSFVCSPGNGSVRNSRFIQSAKANQTFNAARDFDFVQF